MKTDFEYRKLESQIRKLQTQLSIIERQIIKLAGHNARGTELLVRLHKRAVKVGVVS